MAAAMPLPQEDKVSFLRLPMSLTAALFEVSSNAAQVVLYVARHTIGWQNAEIALSSDEFMHGRRKPGRAGGRYDDGLKKIRSRNTLKKAIQEAIDAGLLQEHSAEYLRSAHIFFIPALFFSCSEIEQENTPAPVTPLQLVQKLSKACSEIEQDHAQKMSKHLSKIDQEPSRQTRQEEARRVAIDTSIDTHIDTKEDTITLAPLARASKDAQVEVEEVKYPLQGHKAIAQAAQTLTPAISPERAELEDDLRRNQNYLDQAQRAGANFKRIADLKRTIADLKAKLELLPASSDSQEQDNETARPALYEEQQEQAPISLNRARYQDELEELRAIADDAKSAWLEKQREFDNEVDGSKRRAMRTDVNLLRERFDEAHWRLALSELAVEFIEQGMSRQEAFDEAYNRLSEPQDDPPAPPADDTPAVLFPEAEPEKTQEEKQPATLYQVLGSMFFDMEHASDKDKKDAAIVADRIKKRGLAIEDVQERYQRWLRKFADLQRKTIYHFEQNIAVKGVAL